MKYHIEKNTVQETLVIPLYGRKMCSELYPNLYRDETAIRLIDEIDYDFSDAAKSQKAPSRSSASSSVAMRQNDLAVGGAGLSEDRTRTRRSSTSAAGWTPPADAVTTEAAKFTISTSRTSSPCATSCFRQGSGRRISPAT